MLRLSRLCGLALLAWPIAAVAQTPDLTAITERLDRLERENRALADEVRALRARLDGPTTAAVAAGDSDGAGSAAHGAEAKPAEPAAAVPLEQRVDDPGAAHRRACATKVEASQKFPIRLTGMALFNAS